jgi:hypothetical protein
MVDSFRADIGPSFGRSDYVTYMPGTHLHPLTRGIPLAFLPSPTLIARGFPTGWGSHALRSAIKGMDISDLATPLSPQHALHKASAPLRAWTGPIHAVTSRPFTDNTLALAHTTRLACGFQTSSIILFEPRYGGRVTLLPGIQHA